MASEVKVDKLSQKGSSGIVITDDIKLSSGKAIKNASGAALLSEDGALGSGVTGLPEVGAIEALTVSTANYGTHHTDSWLATSLTLNITPASSASKVIIMIDLCGISIPDVQAETVRYKIMRDTTTQVSTTSNVFYQNADATDHLQPQDHTVSMSAVDSPSADGSTAVNYTLYAQTRLGNTIQYFNEGGTRQSTIVLIEKP